MSRCSHGTWRTTHSLQPRLDVTSLIHWRPVRIPFSGMKMKWICICDFVNAVCSAESANHWCVSSTSRVMDANYHYYCYCVCRLKWINEREKRVRSNRNVSFSFLFLHGYRVGCMPFGWYELSNGLHCIKNFNRICVELSVIQSAWNGFSHVHGYEPTRCASYSAVCAMILSFSLPSLYSPESWERRSVFFSFQLIASNSFRYRFLLFIHFVCGNKYESNVVEAEHGINGRRHHRWNGWNRAEVKRMIFETISAPNRSCDIKHTATTNSVSSLTVYRAIKGSNWNRAGYIYSGMSVCVYKCKWQTVCGSGGGGGGIHIKRNRKVQINVPSAEDSEGCEYVRRSVQHSRIILFFGVRRLLGRCNQGDDEVFPKDVWKCFLSSFDICVHFVY